MKITKIEVQKKNKERVNIYIDESFACGLNMELVYTHSLSKGMEIEPDFLNQVLLKDEELKARDSALNFLSHRIRSEKEVRNKLKDLGYDENIIDETIDFLYRNELLDDYAFAEAFIKDKINLNNYGPKKIQYELYLRGIDRTISNEILSKDESEYDRCMKAALKKHPSYEGQDRSKVYLKLSNFLQRRGFNYSVVRDVVGELLD